MIYYLLKLCHVIFGCTLMGLIVGVVAPVMYGLRCYPTDWQKRTLNRSLLLSLFGVIPVAFIQMGLGSSIIAVQDYSTNLFWVRASYAGFSFFIISWCASIYCLSSWRLARRKLLRSHSVCSFKGYYHRWLVWVLLSALSLIVMVFMMANRLVV